MKTLEEQLEILKRGAVEINAAKLDVRAAAEGEGIRLHFALDRTRRGSPSLFPQVEFLGGLVEKPLGLGIEITELALKKEYLLAGIKLIGGNLRLKNKFIGIRLFCDGTRPGRPAADVHYGHRPDHIPRQGNIAAHHHVAVGIHQNIAGI